MRNLFKIFGFIMLFLAIHSCSEEIDESNRYVFKRLIMSMPICL